MTKPFLKSASSKTKLIHQYLPAAHRLIESDKYLLNDSNADLIGLYQTLKKQGYFNVPFGRKRSLYFSASEMQFFVANSPRMTVICGDFQEVFKYVKTYDPPCVALTETASFTDGFNWNDQLRLLQQIERGKKNCRSVVLSNHDACIEYNVISRQKKQVVN